jgi:AraC-like DNA-binding protein
MYSFILENLMLLELCGKFSQKNNWNHTGKKLNYNLLVYIESGSCEFVINNKTLFLNKNDILIIPKNTFYKPNTVEGCSYMYFWFRADVSDKINAKSYLYGESLPSKTSLILPQKFTATPIIKEYLCETLNNMCSIESLSKMQMSISFLNALLKLSAQVCEPSTIFEQIKKYLNLHICDKVTLVDISKNLGYTKQHIIRIFKENINITPMVYINNEKLSIATKLLFETNYSIEKISTTCGFEDPNYFSRLFKKRYGLSPTKYKDEFSRYL